MPGAAFFDLDRTVVARPSGLAFGNNFYHAGLISRSILIRGYIAQTIYLMRGADAARMEKWRLQGLDLTRGYEREGFGRIIQASMAEVIGPIIYSEAIEAMEWHRSMRRKVYLVSSSPEEFACPIGEMLGVDGVIATRSKVDDAGCYVGELEFYCYGPHKAEAMAALAAEHGLELAKSWAYSDSITDLPMLEAVGHPVAANPDRGLRRVAAGRGWKIERYRRPVKLRLLRVATSTSRRRMALTAGAAASAAALTLRKRRSPLG